MRSNNAVIKKCVVQCFGVQTPEWTQVVPKSSQDDPKMVPSLQNMTPIWLPDSQITPMFSDFVNSFQSLRTQWKIRRALAQRRVGSSAPIGIFVLYSHGYKDSGRGVWPRTLSGQSQSRPLQSYEIIVFFNGFISISC